MNVENEELLYIITFKFIQYFIKINNYLTSIMKSSRTGENNISKIEFYALSKDILRFRRDAFIFVLIMILFLFYVTFSLEIISFVTFSVLSLLMIFLFFISYFTPKHKLKVKFALSDRGIKAGIIYYKWRYFNSFFVMKSNKKYYFFLKGALFDSLFPVVIPINQREYITVFHLIRRHLTYEEL